MASVPSIKGSVFAGLVERVTKLLDEGQVARADLSRWLEPADLACLDESVVVSRWYDIRTYDRLNHLLLEVEGEGDVQYLREMGAETARRLLDGGLYIQMEYLSRTEVERNSDPQARREAFGRDLRLLCTLGGSILNFSRWEARRVDDDPYGWVIEVTEAGDMPDSLVWRSDGFINGMAAIHSHDDLWRWERPSRSRLVFRMNRHP